MQEHDLLRVACAPASYYRPWRVAYAGLQPAQQRWLNAQLLQQRMLALPERLELPRDPLARQLLRQWSQLPQVALLMAAARLRRWVLSERASAALPVAVHAFMRLGHAEASGPRPAQDVATPDQLMAWGSVGVLACCAQLPAWLYARLPLHFSGLPLPAVSDAADPDLLWSALHHAEKVS